MSGERLLKEIGDFCRDTGLAESTFGRLAINDGKLVSRLRDGGRITTETLDRLRVFMERRRETSLHANSASHNDGLAQAIPFTPMRLPARRSYAPDAHERADRFPLFRQPAKISSFRQHMQ